jgi:hypothetical protein
MIVDKGLAMYKSEQTVVKTKWGDAYEDSLKG